MDPVASAKLAWIALYSSIVRDCRDLPGYELFQYVDESGARHPIDSSDVNAYLKEVTGDVTGEDFTAKDFRTWAGTIPTAPILAAKEPCASQSSDGRRNRPATCRNYYVHPAIVESWMDGSLAATMKSAAAAHDDASIYPEETRVIPLIRRKSAALRESLVFAA